MSHTWPEIAEMRRGAALMLQGCPWFAWQIGDGSYRPCRYPAQLARYESDIFEGIKTAGFYAIRPDDLTRWGAIDFDSHGAVGSGHWLDVARRAFDTLAPKCAEAWLVESSPGGFHVVTFLPGLVAARDVRAMLGECAPAGVEVFPKQDIIRGDDPKAKGSLLRFPGKHQAKGTWARFIARRGLIAEPEKGITPAAARTGKWKEPKAGKWKESTEGERLESLYAVATRGISITGPRQRFNAMQKIAARLKGRAKTEADAEWVHDTFYNRHKRHIGTPFVESRIEFLTWFRKAAPCNVELPDYPLSPAEAAA
ncbi:MAG: hypothetical protein FJ388_22595 [Verrucomicrobia bacterium]|nr:hypothetical protein [Verrucomicrobiota bacterium]